MKRAGFTFAEMLACLCVIAVLFAVGVPSAFYYFLEIRQAYLDDCARAIYMSASEELQSMNATGRIRDLPDEPFIELDEAVSAFKSLTNLVDDFTSVIIEYDKTSAGVVGVYLSREMPAEALKSGFLAGDFDDGVCRANLAVGYCGGDPATWKRGEIIDLKPKITVFNREDLWLEITCKVPENADSTDLQLTVNLSANGVTEPAIDIQDINAGDGLYTARVLLEGMGTEFATTHGALIGDLVTATAEIVYKPTLQKTSPDDMQKSAVTFDPLFEDRDGGTVKVSRVRHLKNLKYLTSGKAEMTRDIDFDSVNPDDFFTSRFAHDPTISPIDLSCDLNGCGHLIKNMKIAADGAIIALFGNVSGKVENLHIINPKSIFAEENQLVAGLCARLMGDGIISNCSVSELEIKTSDGCTFGGIAAVSEGKIVNSSASMTSVELGNNCSAGGICGNNSGDIFCTHSSGIFRSGSGCHICGIAPGGSINNCLSECSTGYISGSIFDGISDFPALNSYFTIENGWLSESYESAEIKGNACPEGFGFTYREVVGGEVKFTPKPSAECVMWDGMLTRFGEVDDPAPRGLIGLVEVTYDGTKYSYNLINSFDGYGNDSGNFPEVTWTDPSPVESRYYAFYSKYAYPEGGVDGFEVTTNCTVESEIECGYFLCQRLVGPGSVNLRFGDIERAFEIPGEVQNEPTGYVGVLMSETVFDWSDELFDFTMMTNNSYLYYDFEARKFKDCEPNFSRQNAIPEIDGFSYDIPNDYEIRIYIFASNGLTLGADFDYEGISDPTSWTTVDSFSMMELYRGDVLDPVSVYLEVPGAGRAQVRLESDGYISRFGVNYP